MVFWHRSSVHDPALVPLSVTCSTLEAAQRLGVSIQTVQRWVDVGQLRAWKTVGGHRRIETASVEQLLRERQVGAASTAAQTSRHPRVTTVLVVDDDPAARDLMMVLVSEALPEAQVSVATNGFEALLAIGQSVPDVLVTDVMMPNMNGFEMITHLDMAGRARPGLIVATSSYSLHELRALGQLPPGVDFLPKPVDSAALGHLLSRADDGVAAPIVDRAVPPE